MFRCRTGTAASGEPEEGQDGHDDDDEADEVDDVVHGVSSSPARRAVASELNSPFNVTTSAKVPAAARGRDAEA